MREQEPEQELQGPVDPSSPLMTYVLGALDGIGKLGAGLGPMLGQAFPGIFPHTERYVIDRSSSREERGVHGGGPEEAAGQRMLSVSDTPELSGVTVTAISPVTLVTLRETMMEAGPNGTLPSAPLATGVVPVTADRSLTG